MKGNSLDSWHSPLLSSPLLFCNPGTSVSTSVSRAALERMSGISKVRLLSG